MGSMNSDLLHQLGASFISALTFVHSYRHSQCQLALPLPVQNIRHHGRHSFYYNGMV